MTLANDGAQYPKGSGKKTLSELASGVGAMVHPVEWYKSKQSITGIPDDPLGHPDSPVCVFCLSDRLGLQMDWTSGHSDHYIPEYVSLNRVVKMHIQISC